MVKDIESFIKEDQMVRRFAVARKDQIWDPHRPIYHYQNPEYRMNDPNGLSFWNGNWHLFYQAYPEGEGIQHWGHTFSKDLVHWRDLPYAISPGPEKACLSGNTLVEEDRVIAMYGGIKQGVMAAVSSDPYLMDWEKVTGRAVIPYPWSDDFYKRPDMGVPVDREHPELQAFDSSIFKKDGMYYAICGGRRLNGPKDRIVRAHFLFRSPNLEEWEYLHPFVEEDIFTMVGDDGGCPNFLPIGDRHILIFFSHVSASQYLLGDYDKQRDKFVATSHGRFNFGAVNPGGIHAPTATSDRDGSVIVIFNINPARIGPPGMIMSLPRRLSLTGQDEIKMEPAGDIQSLRRKHVHVGRKLLPANKEIVLDQVNGNAMEIVANIKASSAPMIEMNVFRSPDREEVTRISFYRNRGFINRGHREGPRYSLVSIDSSYSSLGATVPSRAPETASVAIEEDEDLNLRIFIDKSVLEVYVNNKQCVAVRVYPGVHSTGVSLRSQGLDSELISLDAWDMENIYKDTEDLLLDRVL